MKNFRRNGKQFLRQYIQINYIPITTSIHSRYTGSSNNGMNKYIIKTISRDECLDSTLVIYVFLLWIKHDYEYFLITYKTLLLGMTKFYCSCNVYTFNYTMKTITNVLLILPNNFDINKNFINKLTPSTFNNE